MIFSPPTSLDDVESLKGGDGEEEEEEGEAAARPENVGEGDEEEGEGEKVVIKIPPRADGDEDPQYPDACFPDHWYEKMPILKGNDESPFWQGWAMLRLKTFRLIENKYFETAVIIMILLSSLALVSIYHSHTCNRLPLTHSHWRLTKGPGGYLPVGEADPAGHSLLHGPHLHRHLLH